MNWKRFVVVLPLFLFVISCVSDKKETQFKWDQTKEREEVELLVSYMEAYPLVFKEGSRIELQQLFVKRTALLEAFNKGVYSDDEFQNYWDLRKVYLEGLDLKRLGNDRFEREYKVLKEEDPKSFLKLSEFIYTVFRSDKNEVKSIVANQIQAQNSVK